MINRNLQAISMAVDEDLSIEHEMAYDDDYGIIVSQNSVKRNLDERQSGEGKGCENDEASQVILLL